MQGRRTPNCTLAALVAKQGMCQQACAANPGARLTCARMPRLTVGGRSESFSLACARVHCLGGVAPRL